MKKLLCSILLASIIFSVYAQDSTQDRWLDSGTNTAITLPQSGSVNITSTALSSGSYERLLQGRISDSSGDFCSFDNGTDVVNNFVPVLVGHRGASSNRTYGLVLMGTIVSGLDVVTNSTPVIDFNARISASGGMQSLGSPILNRDLFQWRNFDQVKMLMKANGNLGIGTTNPTAVLHTVGTVRFENLPTTGTPAYSLAIDGNGSVIKNQLNSGSVILNCANIGYLPRVAASNTLGCSQFVDDGVNTAIGTAPIAGVKLTINGTLLTLSDKKFKKDITPLQGALKKLTQLQGYSYRWKSDEFPEMGFSDKKTLGFLSQEVTEVIPEATHVNDEGITFMDYNAIIPLLVESIKEQQQLIGELRLEIDYLKNAIKKNSQYSNDNINNDKFDIFPNPTNGTFSIEWNIVDFKKNLTLQILDASGHINHSYAIKNNIENYSLTLDAPSGQYTAIIIENNRVILSKHFFIIKN